MVEPLEQGFGVHQSPVHMGESLSVGHGMSPAMLNGQFERPLEPRFARRVQADDLPLVPDEPIELVVQLFLRPSSLTMIRRS